LRAIARHRRRIALREAQSGGIQHMQRRDKALPTFNSQVELL
jgi:hypothetical protein